MAFNGSGTFNRLYDWTDERDAGNNIDSVKMDAEDDGFATGLSNCVTKDGQTTVTANLPMATYKHTNVGAASARTDYARASDCQDSKLQVLGSVSGTDTITAAASPAITAYAAGQTFRFVPAGANTGAVTLNINSVGAKSVTKAGTNALVAGDIPANAMVTVVYDGTRFQLLPVPNISAAAATVLDDASTDDMLTTLGGTSTGTAIFKAANAAAGMAEVTPTTTRGDIIVRDASADTRLAVGSSGQVLTSDGTDAVWGDNGVPTGTMMPYAGTEASIPTGWLLCYGQTVSQTTYADLYTVCGTIYGSDAGGNFTLPDLRGRIVAAPDDMGGTGAGRIASNALDGEGSTTGDDQGNFGTNIVSFAGGGTVLINQANSVVQPMIGINWIIKT